MKKASIFVLHPYTNNNIFDINNKILNRDNCLYHYYLLKEELKKNSIDFATSDINKPAESELVIYCDMPENLPTSDQIEKSYLIIIESDIIKPENWNTDNHQYFKKIFTWNDRLVDNIKYIKVNTFPVLWDKEFPGTVKKEKLCVIVSGNKSAKASNELYSERIKAIRWFEKYHPEDFDLYGMGWDKRFSGRLSKYLNRFNVLRKIFAPYYPSYKGKIEEKKEVLSRYRFSICYENALDITGYITEKIFDCFVSACVPVYLGASNIKDFIPGGCFIDKNNFNSYEELYQFLNNMPENEYCSYLNNIKSFLESSKMYPFSPQCFAEVVARELLK